MIRVPASALLLGLLGLIPFLWGAIVSLGVLDSASGDLTVGGITLISANDGQLLMVRYGVIILCFMAGVLWGFATRANGPQATLCYMLSVIPALWAFLFPGTGVYSALMNLMIGFTMVLMIDYAFWWWQLAPRWWMALRIPLSVIVLGCLGVGAWL